MSHAHTVVTVDTKGVIQNISSIGVGIADIDVLAIIGPARIEGVRIEAALWAEIGIGRSTPYGRTWRQESGVIQPRRTGRSSISLATQRTLFSEVMPVLQRIVNDRTEEWKSRTWLRKPSRDSDVMMRGIFITIPDNLPYFAYSILEKDRRFRKSSHLLEVSEICKETFDRYGSFNYTDKWFRNREGLTTIAGVIHDAAYGPIALSDLIDLFGRRSGKNTNRAVFDQILETWDIKPVPNEFDSMLQGLRKIYNKIAPADFKGHVRVPIKRRRERIKQPKSYPKGAPKRPQAQGMLRFELTSDITEISLKQ